MSLRHGVLRVLCRSVCWFLYGPFCHGALKLDIYIVYNILSLNISSIYIIFCRSHSPKKN